MALPSSRSPKARRAGALTAIIVSALAPVATSKAFLNAPMAVPLPPLAPHVYRHEEVSLEASLHDAVGGVSESSRATAGHSDLSKIERSLQSMWRALPRNAYGRVEVKALRYLIHRYFMRTSGLIIPGIEPSSSRLVNKTSLHFMDYIESTLGVGRDHHGFTQPEAAVVIATLEQLIFDADERLLAEAYQQEALNEMALLSRQELENVLKTYVVMWMTSEDRNGYESRHAMSGPFWRDVAGLVEGLITGLEFDQHRSLPLHRAGAALARKHSLEDAHQIAGSITRNFMAYSGTQCSEIKAELVSMDRDGSGRVPIADFYRRGAVNRRFAEAESYLRELGALDETSAWRGPQVIIPNYIQAASNCAVRTDEYLLCCRNECEDILGEIEEAVGAPSATPGEILAVLGNMTQHADFAEVEAEGRRSGWARRMTSRSGRLRTTQALREELARAAEVHAGAVPLHGRLFAQFLHYHFPQECAFPHRAGTTRMVTPREFGLEEGVLQAREMREKGEQQHENAHLAEEDFVDEEGQLMDRHVMSQAHAEEEYSLSPLARAAPSGGRSPSSSAASRRLFGLLLAAGGVLALVLALLLTSEGGLPELRASLVAGLGLDQLSAACGAARKASLV